MQAASEKQYPTIVLDFCVECGGEEIVPWHSETENYKFGKIPVTVHDITGTQCTQCKEVYFDANQHKDLDRKIIDAVRLTKGLLSSSELIRIFESLEQQGFSISKLSESLGVSRQEIHRWLSGQRLQSEMADTFLRFIDANPSAFVGFAASRGLKLKPKGNKQQRQHSKAS
jgi:YgiT-type zinc finger domain-containing protein